MDQNILVLEYQDSFADNLSVYAYGKIAENKFNVRTYWENSTNQRDNLEYQMGDFKLNYSYISKNRVSEVQKKSDFMDYRDFSSRKLTKDKILSLNRFKIDDIKLINDEIRHDFEFNNLNFIKNFDILEKITTQNSIGLYINKNDEIDLNYIQSALKRLNKYLKNPKVFIFASNIPDFESDIPYETLKLNDWREEFYFLKSCKHKIIYCAENSYSQGLWASILSDKKFGYVVYDKKLKALNPPDNWIKI